MTDKSLGVAPRDEVRTRQAVTRDYKIKKDDQEIEERVEFAGDGQQIGQSKSK